MGLALAYLLAIWVTHALLRMVLIFRNDAFGFAYVNKPDWYIFHAFAMDFIWILNYSLPFLILIFLFRNNKNIHRFIWFLLGAFHSILLLFTVGDHETQRFMGMHLDWSFLSTYGNTSAMKEVLKFVASDLSLKFLPYALILLCIPFSIFAFRIMERFSWAKGIKPKRTAIWVALIYAVCYAYINWIWPGGFRERKLKPVVQILLDDLSRKDFSALNTQEFSNLSAFYQNHWQQIEGDSDWVFTDSAHPYVRMPLMEYCQSLEAHLILPVTGFPQNFCMLDKDQDGYSVSKDCNDRDSTIHNGAIDYPSDGIDQNCDGLDAQPKNIVMIVMESHRAVNCGFLKPYGAHTDATPYFDSLAKNVQVWTRFNVAGLPTVTALITIHESILPHPSRIVASDFATLKQHAFTAIFGEYGYKTHFFSTADPAWDSQITWLRQWYQDFTYDRHRETDALMLSHMAKWMKDSLTVNKPFFLTAMTKSNHYPFNAVEGVKDLPSTATLQDRMAATMTYTDNCIKQFMHSVENEPWYANTIFVFMADHGFALAEHSKSDIGFGLYTESTWIPFIMSGSHPFFKGEAWHHYPASQLDIGPTLLDMVGIKTTNHFMGHSMFRTNVVEKNISYCLRDGQGVIESGPYRAHGGIVGLKREQGAELFNILQDKIEYHNLLPQHQAEYDSLLPIIQNFGKLNLHLLEQNLVWPL